MGMPDDRSLRCALLAHGVAVAAGHSPREVRDAVYVSLLRFAGCTADARTAARVMGDEVATRGEMYGRASFAEPREMLAFVWRHAGQGRGFAGQVATFARALARMPELYQTAVAHCEVNDLVVERLGVAPSTRAALADAFECWNGMGVPRRLRGDAIALPARVAVLADDLEAAHHYGGVDGALDRARFASGRALDPALCDTFRRHAATLCAPLDASSPAEALSRLALDDDPTLDDATVEALAAVLGDFADLKCRYTVGHSSAVAELVTRAAALASVPASERATLRRAAFVHDLGRVAVTASIWEHPGPLSDAQRERVRMHALHTERLLARTPVLAPLSDLAGAAHERLAGGGYHRGLPPLALGRAARLLAAADVYQALRSERPHRPARDAERARSAMRDEVREGRLDADATEAVLAAAGETPAARPRAVAGLTERELEVLSLLARGMSNRAIADALGVAPKTAGNHVQAVFRKAGVTTRSGAAMFAMRHGLAPGERS